PQTAWFFASAWHCRFPGLKTERSPTWRLYWWPVACAKPVVAVIVKQTAAVTAAIEMAFNAFSFRLSPSGDTAEQHAAVVAAEAHRVRERDVHLHAARLVRDVVEVAVGVGLAVIDRRRQDPVAHRERAEDRLDRAGGGEGVPHHRLARRDGELV